MSIVQLPDRLANQIAAGEVVERPASVVKELVENSIDAGSSWIKIDLKEAGLEQIKVIDNGEGMSADDSELAFLRHATSKIKTESDLFRVQTLGFRGEALASIASVSKLVLRTSTGDNAGTYLELEGGEIIERNKSSARQGTEIIVNELFFNTPARLKYMKTIHTELSHITDLLTRLAFAHPNIRFEVNHNRRTIFKTTGSNDLLQVLAQVYGMKVAQGMLPVEKETIDFHLKGYIAKPDITRANRSYITFIINGRYIHSIALQQAVLRAYHTLLPMRRYPITVLAIEMDPYLVDVNVHPTKLEVRFSKEKELVHVIEVMIRDAFRKKSLIPEMSRKVKQKEEKSVQDNLDFEFTSRSSDGKEQVRDFKQKFQAKEVKEDFKDKEKTKSIGPSSKDNRQEDKRLLFIKKNNEQTIDAHQDRESRVPIFYPIGQFHGTYILAQNEQGLYMIDQHAAQERIKYEEFKKKLAKPVTELQDLLIPMTVDFTQSEALLIERYKNDLENLGLYFESFGSHTYIIRSYPTWFPEGYEEEIIRDILDQFMKRKEANLQDIRDEAAMMMACKRSIRANENLTEEEMFQLLRDLRDTRDPYTCPHGRPVIIHFSTKEVEKMFKRIM